MSEVAHYDILVLGSGEAGKYLAWTMASAGHRTAVVERRLGGGSCPNIACLPSKNVIHGAKVALFVARPSTFGVETGSPRAQMQAVRQRKARMVEDLVAVHNLGAHATLPDVPGLKDAAPLAHVEALELERVSGHLIVLGSGYVGLEFAQAMRRFGADVTVIERGPQLAGREDPDVGAALLDLFHDEGIRVLLESEARRVEGRSGQEIRVRLTGPRGDQTSAEASELMATVQTAMLGDLPFTALRDALFTHPTAAEGLTVLLANVRSQP